MLNHIWTHRHWSPYQTPSISGGYTVFVRVGLCGVHSHGWCAFWVFAMNWPVHNHGSQNVKIWTCLQVTWHGAVRNSGASNKRLLSGTKLIVLIVLLSILYHIVTLPHCTPSLLPPSPIKRVQVSYHWMPYKLVILLFSGVLIAHANAKNKKQKR